MHKTSVLTFSFCSDPPAKSVIDLARGVMEVIVRVMRFDTHGLHPVVGIAKHRDDLHRRYDERHFEASHTAKSSATKTMRKSREDEEE